MPSTTDERAALMQKWFGNASHDDCARYVLGTQGFLFSRDGMIHKPSPSHTMTFEQFEMVAYLIEEWDHGFHYEAPYRNG